MIHEFDPWFNFRTTKQLVENGFYEFVNWFDQMSWYPLGRVVGGTVYPGIMVRIYRDKIVLIHQGDGWVDSSFREFAQFPDRYPRDLRLSRSLVLVLYGRRDVLANVRGQRHERWFVGCGFHWYRAWLHLPFGRRVLR